MFMLNDWNREVFVFDGHGFKRKDLILLKESSASETVRF